MRVRVRVRDRVRDRARVRVSLLGGTEVSELDVTLAVDEDVLRLKVAVHVACRV